MAEKDEKKKKKKKRRRKKRRWTKRLIKWVEKRCLTLLISLAQLLLSLLMSTVRVKWYGLGKLEKLHRQGTPLIYAFWHQRMLIFVFSHRNQKVHVLISSHRDGEIITRIIGRYGFETARGSSTRGGREGFYELMEYSQQGYDVAITPDGPRGPRHKVQPGVIGLAQKTGLPIIAGAYAADRCWKFKTWDRFVIPKPFSSIAIVASDPIYIPRHLTKEEFEEERKKVEKIMVDQIEKARKLSKNPQPPYYRGVKYWKPRPARQKEEERGSS